MKSKKMFELEGRTNSERAKFILLQMKSLSYLQTCLEMKKCQTLLNGVRRQRGWRIGTIIGKNCESIKHGGRRNHFMFSV